MNAMHTTGPWRVGDAGMTVFGPRTDAPSPVTVARLAPGADARANARLLAAAPDLLAACEEVGALIGDVSNAALWPTLGPVAVKLRAAIAKARQS